MVWQLPDVEYVAVVDPRVAPLLPGRQVASVFGLSVHLPHKPCKREKYLDPSDNVLLWIRCLPNIFWVMNHICPTGGPAQKTWKHHQVKRNWWSMVMRRTCQQKYLLKNIKFRENEKQLIDTNVSSAHYAGSWWPCLDSSSWTATIYPCVKTDPDPSTRKT